MNVQHQELADGRWAKMSLAEQMANIGSEVERALSWRGRKNEEYAVQAAERALELFDLSLAAHKEGAKLRELSRGREAWAEYFFGANTFNSNDQEWKNYFNPFLFAARKHL